MSLFIKHHFKRRANLLLPLLWIACSLLPALNVYAYDSNHIHTSFIPEFTSNKKNVQESSNNIIRTSNTGSATKKLNSSSTSKFEFCKGQAGLTCTQAGKGYEVCETYLKNLNNLPKSAKPNACVPQISSLNEKFALPVWQTMDIQENLDLIYQIDYLIPPSTKKKEEFGEWVKRYNESLKKKGFKPVLKKTEVKLSSSNTTETVISYNQGNSEKSGCRDGMPLASSGSTESYLFVLDDRSGKTIKEIKGLIPTADLILFKGTPFLMYQENFSSYWYISLFKVESPYSSTPDHHIAALRCEFIQLHNK